MLGRFDFGSQAIPQDFLFMDGEVRRAGPSTEELVAGAVVVTIVAGVVTLNQANQQVKRGQAPQSVERVDKGGGPHEEDHVHFKGGQALNRDGTWKHGAKGLTNKEKDWLKSIGWDLPAGQ